MTTLLQDLRHALRVLANAPGFTAVAVLTLTLGVGADTALFSVVNGVLLSPLPYPRPSELVAVYARSRETTQGYVTYLNFLDWQRENQTFASMAMYRNQDYNFTGAGSAERLSGNMVSADFFRTLGVQPALGRFFTSVDDQVGAAPVVILGGGFWTRRFAASPDVLGRAITLNGASYTIVGVIPAGFVFYGAPRDVYTPLGQLADPSFRDRRIDLSAHAVGRLKPSVTLEQARADMDTVSRNLARAYPDADKDVGIHLMSLKQDLVGDVQPLLLLLLGAVGFLLLIACANVANLLLARAVGRSRDFAIRAALGASHGRVLRQLLTESLLLAGLGGALGFLLAAWGTRATLDLLPGALPRASEVALDWRVFFFTIGASLFAGIVFGLAPALKTSRVDLRDVLNESGRSSTGARHRLQGAFVATEVALALVLLVGAGLMIRTLGALWRVDPGFTPGHAITFDLSLPGAASATSAHTRARLRQFDATMRAIPGVEAVSVTLGSRPMIHDSALPFWIEGEPKPATTQDMHQAMFYLVEAGFQRAMGVPLARGRFITPQDDEHAPIVIDIDDVFARTYFPNQNPIGRRINFAAFEVQAEVVGVVGHVRQWGLGADPTTAIEAQFDYPFMQLPERLMPLVAEAVAVVLRTAGDPTAVMPDVRRAVAALDPGEVVYSVQTLDEVVANSFAARRLSMLLLGGFAAVALLLACVGISAVSAYLVDQRTHEIGLRVALGAQRGDILRLVVGHGAGMALIGIIVGTAAALGLTGLMATELFGVTAHDPLTFAAVAALLTVVALAACYLPARRALRVDPVVALGRE
jgi:predicted permease